MTTLKSIDLTCPNCDYQFTSEAIEIEETGGRKQTDFQIAIEGVQPLLYGVHLCERCGFAGLESSFTSAGVSFEVRQHVWDELTPKLLGVAIAASEKYEFAAKVASWDSVPLRLVGDLWLRAAWCCVDEGDTEAERYYRRHAAWTFEEALGTYDAVDLHERAVLTYLVGELWRRIGDTTRANSWFNLVTHEIVDEDEQEWVIRLTKQQLENPREWFV